MRHCGGVAVVWMEQEKLADTTGCRFAPSQSAAITQPRYLCESNPAGNISRRIGRYGDPAQQSPEGIYRGFLARRPFLLPNPQRNIGERVEPARQPRVFLAAPLSQAVVAFRERRQPGYLCLPDFGRTTTTDTYPVHQAMPPERERAEAPTGFDGLVDGTAVLARQPRPTGRSAGRRPEANDAEILLPRDIATLPYLWRVFIPTQLANARANVKRRLFFAAAPAIPARDVHGQFSNSLAQCGIARA